MIRIKKIKRFKAFVVNDNDDANEKLSSAKKKQLKNDE